MIAVTLVLKVGSLINKVFKEEDEYDLGDDEDVNDILRGLPGFNDHAILIIHVTGWPDNGTRVCTFNKVDSKWIAA